MPYVLHIETSTTSCSVALSKGQALVAQLHYDNGYSHAENLHPFIQKLFNESGVSIKELSAVAVSKGPGSYTGLRIGVSAAKGLAYSLNIPLIAVETLQTMAVAAKKQMPEAAHFCPMIDARRMEAYTAVYDSHLNTKLATEALIIDADSIKKFAGYGQICFFGNGYAKATEILKTIEHATFIDHITPLAENMIGIAFEKFLKKEFEDVNYFEPFYLKDFLILKKADRV